MTVDLRAVVACDLGIVISGDIGSNHISDRSGLVMTSGRLTIEGLLSPARGTAVNILVACPQLNRVTRFPKVLRVIRATAYPLDNRTEVEVGCRLTLMKDRRDDRAFFASVGSSLSAQALLTHCLQQIGVSLAAGTRELDRDYLIPSVDLSQGYVQIIGDLIRSENCFGRLKPNDTLEIVPISLDVGQKGPVLTAADLVSIEPISTGAEPPDQFRVMYSAPNPVETSQQTVGSYWRTNETFSDPQQIYIRYTTQGGEDRALAYTVRALSISRSYYEVREWIDATGKRQQSDVLVLKRDVKETALGAINSSFLSSCLRYDLRPVDFSATICNANETTYQYRPTTDGLTLIREITEQKMTPMEFAAGMQVPDYVSVNAQGVPTVTYTPDYVTSTSNALFGVEPNLYVTTRTIVENETVTDGNRAKTITKTSRWLSRGLTQEGQQEFQWALKDRADNGVVPGLVDQFRALKFEGTEIQVSEGRAPSYSVSTVGAVLFSAGQLLDDITTTATYDIPYTPDSDADDAALSFGRVESSLDIGHAYGHNIVTAFDRLPTPELSPVYIRLAGLEVAFLTDSLSYAFDASGMVVSSDLMLLGVTGYYGSTPPSTSWIRLPVAPSALQQAGNTSSDSVAAKANSISYPGGFDVRNPAATFAAIGNSGVDTFAAYKTNQQLISPVVKIDQVTLATGPVLVAREFEYALDAGTDVAAFASGPIIEFAWVTIVAVPAAGVTLTGRTPAVSSGASVAAPVSVMAVSALAPAVNSGATITVPAAGVSVAGVVPDVAGRQKTQILVPLAGIDIAALAPRINPRVNIAAPASIITVAGATPSAIGAHDPYFSSNSLGLHFDGANNSTTFTDSSSNAFTITRVGDTKISTAQSKFGGASAYFDGSGDYLTCPTASGAFNYGSGNFTIQAWVNVDDTVGIKSIAGVWPSDAQGSWRFLVVGDTIQFLWITSTGTSATAASSVCITSGTWEHVAAVRNGGTITLYNNAVSVGSASISGSIRNTASTLSIGRNEDSNTWQMKGYMDDLLITKGVARTITLPTAAFLDR